MTSGSAEVAALRPQAEHLNIPLAEVLSQSIHKYQHQKHHYEREFEDNNDAVFLGKILVGSNDKVGQESCKNSLESKQGLETHFTVGIPR